MTDTMITHTMPDAETIYNRMNEVANIGSDVERFYRLFATTLANKEQYQTGVAVAWELSMHELVNKYGASPLIRKLISMRYNDYMKSIFNDNVEFATACIEWREMILAEVRK